VVTPQRPPGAGWLASAFPLSSVSQPRVGGPCIAGAPSGGWAGPRARWRGVRWGHHGVCGFLVSSPFAIPPSSHPSLSISSPFLFSSPPPLSSLPPLLSHSPSIPFSQPFYSSSPPSFPLLPFLSPPLLPSLLSFLPFPLLSFPPSLLVLPSVLSFLSSSSLLFLSPTFFLFTGCYIRDINISRGPRSTGRGDERNEGN
jgi:hypothetical protein